MARFTRRGLYVKRIFLKRQMRTAGVNALLVGRPRLCCRGYKVLTLHLYKSTIAECLTEMVPRGGLHFPEP